MKEVKELEFDKEVLKRIEMICKFAYVKPIIKQEVLSILKALKDIFRNILLFGKDKEKEMIQYLEEKDYDIF